VSPGHIIHCSRALRSFMLLGPTYSCSWPFSCSSSYSCSYSYSYSHSSFCSSFCSSSSYGTYSYLLMHLLEVLRRALNPLLALLLLLFRHLRRLLLPLLLLIPFIFMHLFRFRPFLFHQHPRPMSMLIPVTSSLHNAG
jgi:hypothetical protein